MKKIITILLTLTLYLGFVACSADNKGATDEPPEQSMDSSQDIQPSQQPQSQSYAPQDNEEESEKESRSDSAASSQSSSSQALTVSSQPASAAPTDITIKGVTYSTSLTELDLSGQSLTSSDIEPLKHMTSLTELLLGSNQITDINALSGLTKLTWLALDNNQITDISALGGLTELTWLNLDANKISDVSTLGGLTNLRELGLRENPTISEAQIEELRAALPNCFVNDVGIPENPLTGKPVIYLYPQRTQDVSVKLNFDGVFTYTYPAYNGGWTVTASPDGSLVNKADGSRHYYLFWEGVPNFNDWDFSTGFVVKGSEVEAFLLDKLPKLGLTPREYNDFITYWVPQMVGNEYNLVTFATKEYEAIAELTVLPKPDTFLIVHMVYKAIPAPVPVLEQVLPPAPQRNGFTVVEWGGTRAV